MSSAFDEASVRTPAQHARILARSRDAQFTMNSDVLTGSLLRSLAASKPRGALLELGTGCGLGSCWLLDGMDPDSRLTSIDNDPAVQAIAREELGADPRLTFVLEDGGTFLERCDSRFDLIYADAWPGKYSHLERALGLLHPGGIYVIDDMLPQPNWPADHPPKVAALLDTLDQLRGFEIAKLAWSTGVVICTKR
jgi:predicted O-methyltransferase YrrM